MKTAVLLLLGCMSVRVPGSAQIRFAPDASHDSAAVVPLPRLAVPSGSYGIGRVAYHWTDAMRADRFTEDRKAHRELMVYLWYPTVRSGVPLKGIYLPGAREMDAVPALRLRMIDEFGSHWSSVVSNTVASHAVEGAQPAGRTRQMPVVIFSHGNGSTSFSYTSLIEDMVSHGYVVAAVEHSHSAMAVRFPEGRVVPFREDRIPEGLSRTERLQWMAKAASAGIEEGAADIRFAMRKLEELNASDSATDRLAGRLDLTRMAAMGHSAGGAFAARACQLERRLKACVDLDGAMIPVSALPQFPDGAAMQQPLLLLEAYRAASQMPGTKEEMEQYARIREEQLKASAPGSYNVVLRSAGIAHPSFSDVPLFFAGTQGYPDIETIRRNHRLIQSYVRAFLDKHLRGRRAPLMDAPARQAEATVKSYGQ